MPRVSKVSREGRQSGRTYLCRSKRRFNPNKIIKDETTTKRASSKKIKLNTSASIPEDIKKHYRIVDFLLVFSTIASLVKCAHCDGSRQGFCSSFGVTSLIGYWSGKVTDILITSLHCQACKLWKKQLNTNEFKEWYQEHVENDEWQANQTGPSANMEVNAVIELFGRSEKNYGAKISNYIGDGDSKTYGNLLKAKSYGENFTINKKECAGHMQKRMLKRLRDLVKKTVETKEIKTGTGGKGKLTGKVIDNLSRYYGAAIKHNCVSLEGMKNAIWATFYHLQSTGDNLQHHKCMSGENSWCSYQKALATTGVENFKHDYTPLPQDVIQAIKPIYEDLSKDKLLERCLGGFTQNANKSLNQLIWRIAPKKLSGSKQIVEFTAYVAACTFNEGASAFLTFLSDMNFSVGTSAHEYATFANNNRIDRAEIPTEQQSKEARIKRRLDGAGIDDSI
nr:uncharacterized protein LOC118683174 [Bactrocera oleae]